MQKVDVLEVKRCFVMAQMVRKTKFKKLFWGMFNFEFQKEFLKSITTAEFEEKLKVAKEKVLKMSERKLDKIIRNEWKKRLTAFNNSEWYIGEVSPNEVGVWRRAGGLPLEWTNGSLSETARNVEHAIGINSKRLSGRARHSISNMLKINVQQLQEEKYLLPIIFKGGTGTKGRRRLKRQTAGDIDDGCMRSIALTISGVKSIKAYVGFSKKGKN